jgi:predicted dehydrogenase
MKRIAVIGLGKMGLLHASLLSSMPEVTLVAFCEKSGLVRRFSRAIFPDIAIVDSPEKLSRFNLDAAYVTTPPSSHFAVVKTLLTEKICRDLFVEKPLANNFVESRGLANLLAESDVDSINMVGYNRRFGATFKQAREIISKGILGEPVSFEEYAFSSAFCSSGSRRGNAGRGGVIKDLGSHAIDLALWYLGDIRVESVGPGKVTNGGTIDSASFKVSTDKGLRGQIRASWIEPDYRLPEVGFVIEGASGLALVVNDDKLELRSKHDQRQVWHNQDLNNTAGFLLGSADYFHEDKAFVDAIISRKATEPTFTDALKVDEIIQQVELGMARKS